MKNIKIIIYQIRLSSNKNKRNEILDNRLKYQRKKNYFSQFFLGFFLPDSVFIFGTNKRKVANIRLL